MRFDLEPRDIGRLVDEAVLLYRQHFRTMALAALAILMPVLLLSSVSASAYYNSFFESFIGDPATALNPAAGSPTGDVAVLLAMQVLLYVAVPLRFAAVVWTGSSIYRSTPGWVAGHSLGVREFLASGRHRVIQLGVAEIAIYVIGQAAYAVAGIVAILLLAIAIPFLAVGGIPGAVMAAVLAVLVILAVFTAWLVVMSRFRAWGPAAVAEDGGIGQSLSRSMSLTKGEHWRTVWYWMTVWMVSYAFRALIYTPAILLFVNTVLPFIQDPATVSASIPIWVTAALGVSAAAAETLVIPFERACWSRFYLDLRARREGMDLVIRARELAGEQV